ncbi:YbjN domain-containing protein [Porifericola rhodea]|uniref:YbjN domain-containing protein n=1 Tax=Porifericola rhodea TaxID=930972 RepID=UPI002666C8FD|nr:YbjN domain-containing protein [Porifericola rhodea]WKN31906.1 YbjN domain-containing protein [Porifericola rhodea]
MNTYYTKVKNYLTELNYEIVEENEAEGILIIDNEETGVSHMVLCCAEPILIIEQYLCEIKQVSLETYRLLLQKNRDIIHGAFALDQSGTKLIFRDTLVLDTLDLDELESTFNSLGLLLSEFTQQIIEISSEN